MNVIGIAGYARAGKDTACSIAIDFLKENGINAKHYSFAEQLKKEVAPFLLGVCGVDVWTQDTELKKDIRDFLVWYGTTFWRKRDPQRWIRGVDAQLKSDGNVVDVAIISDVRYPNEAEWVHSWGGYLIHVSGCKYVAADEGRELGGMDLTLVKRFLEAPNEQERINDPIVKELSDYRLEWPIKGLTATEAVCDIELRGIVRRALYSCQWLNAAMIR